MLDDAAVMAFAATGNPKLAKSFYQDTLGLRLVADSPFARVCDSNGVEVRIQKVEKVSPPQGTVLGWRVRNLQQTMTDLSKAGVSFERYSFLELDERGIWTSPDGAQVAWFKDPDANTLSLTQAPD